MLNLVEYTEVVDQIAILRTAFTDETLTAAEYYDVEEDPINFKFKVTLYDTSGQVLAAAHVDDSDVALEFLADEFDLEEYDPEDMSGKDVAGSTRYGHG